MWLFIGLLWEIQSRRGYHASRAVNFRGKSRELEHRYLITYNISAISTRVAQMCNRNCQFHFKYI